MIKTQFELQGLEALNAKLAAINDDLKLKGGRFALRRAANLIRDKARSNAKTLDDPQTPQNISKNIVTRWSGKRFKRTGDLGFRIGILGGARQYADTRENRRKRRVGATYIDGGTELSKNGQPGGDTFYWRFIEFGTVNAPAKPFMRNALQRNISKATSEFIKQYGKSIDRAIKRAGKK